MSQLPKTGAAYDKTHLFTCRLHKKW